MKKFLSILLLIVIPLVIFSARVYTMQHREGQSVEEFYYMYDTVDALCWVIAFLDIYFITYILPNVQLGDKLGAVARIVLSFQIWPVTWNFIDEYTNENNEYHVSEYWFVLFLLIHAIWELINVKRKVVGNN